jgi:hypothetical protein
MSDRDFETYKLLVEEVRAAREARRDMSNMFTTLNLGGVGALGFLMSPSNGPLAVYVVWLSIALILSCLVWMMSNGYYRRLIAVKYTTIYAVEDSMGVSYFQQEWKALPRNTISRWFSLERMMPAIFLVGYALFLASRMGETAPQWLAEAWRTAASWVGWLLQEIAEFRGQR